MTLTCLIQSQERNEKCYKSYPQQNYGNYKFPLYCDYTITITIEKNHNFLKCEVIYSYEFITR